MEKTCIVVPCYNEKVTIRKVVKALLHHPVEIIVIDDGSSFDVRQELSELPIHFLRHKINLGQGAALQTGTEYALSISADYIIHFDGDGQHDPDIIPDLIAAIKKGDKDIIMGSRFMDKEIRSNIPFLRSVILKGAIFINYIKSGIWLTDAHNGLRVMNRRAGECLKFRETRMAYATELLEIISNNKLRIGEIPSKVLYTEYSLEKGQKNRDAIHVLIDIFSKTLFP